jgi:hypothetical protein
MIILTNIDTAAMKVFELGAIVEVMKINVCANISKKRIEDAFGVARRRAVC